jgi:hypothetical protein
VLEEGVLITVEHVLPTLESVELRVSRIRYNVGMLEGIMKRAQLCEHIYLCRPSEGTKSLLQLNVYIVVVCHYTQSQLRKKKAEEPQDKAESSQLAQ